ncbi:MAG: cation transporter, partial [Methanobacteriota archaeon]
AHGHSHGGAAAAEEAEEEEEEGHGHSHGSSGSCSSGHHGHAHGNGASKKESSGGGEANENMYGVYLHVLADALGSVGVIISSILIEWKGWHAADPIASLIISLLILASVVPLARGTIVPLLQGMPAGKEGRIRRALDEITRLPGVSAITQPHFWKHAGRTIVGSVHVHLDGSAQAVDEQSVLRAARRILSAVGVTQLTVQIERQPVPSTVFAAGATSPTGAPIIVWRSHAHEQHGVPHDGHGHSHGGAACDGHGEDRSSECSSAGHGHTHSHGHGHSHGGSATSPACTPSTCSSASGDAAVHSPSHGHSHGGHAHTRGASTVKEDSQPVVSYAHGHSHAHGQCSGGHGHAHS